MTKTEKIKEITRLLKRDYPEVITPLLHQSAFQLLVATMMSAQTLDTTVNKVTPALFKKYKSVEAFSKANPKDINEVIRIVNYHNTKSRNIVAMSKKLLADFRGLVPSTIEELTTLPGVGRKTANVVISEWFAKKRNERGNPTLINPDIYKDEKQVLPEGFVVDTHVLRTAKRLGLSKNTTPEKVEQDLMKIFPRDEWNDMSLRLIFHGRVMCKSQNPQCYLDENWSKICSCVRERKHL